MKLQCWMSGHSEIEYVIYNSGFFFGRCRHCRADLIRTGKGGWESVPVGHSVAWKAGTRHSHSLPADFTGLLPVAVGETRPRAQLPATRNGFFSWSRDLVMKMPRRWRSRRSSSAVTAPAIPDESEEKPISGLLVVALLFGASMRLLLRPRSR